MKIPYTSWLHFAGDPVLFGNHQRSRLDSKSLEHVCRVMKTRRLSEPRLLLLWCAPPQESLVLVIREREKEKWKESWTGSHMILMEGAGERGVESVGRMVFVAKPSGRSGNRLPVTLSITQIIQPPNVLTSIYLSFSVCVCGLSKLWNRTTGAAG